MNKYIDADKLKSEIERQIAHYEKIDRNDFNNGELYICQELLSFIESLEKEQHKTNPLFEECLANVAPEKEKHTLKEWQEILANNPELMAEFEKATPPKPIE